MAYTWRSGNDNLQATGAPQQREEDTLAEGRRVTTRSIEFMYRVSQWRRMFSRR